jgi:serine/threonine protein kinase
MDFLPTGSLDDVLRQLNPPLNWHEQIVLARGIASGMIHLHAEKILHRDLAARNILLGADATPKISDFGMSHVAPKQTGSDFDETKIESNVGPIRWMAPESIRSYIFSPKTDVFSYGILLWEIMTQGKMPHGDMQNLTEVALRRRDECMIPSCPSDAAPIMAKMFAKCCVADPDLRPLFKQIVKKLDKWLEEHPEVQEQEIRQNLKPKKAAAGNPEKSAAKKPRKKKSSKPTSEDNQ